MRFDIITVFPNIFDSYFNESILKRAQRRKLITITIHNLRDFVTDRHRKVDDTPYGGGPGMVMKVEPIVRAVERIKRQAKGKRRKARVILFSTRGKKFDAKTAKRLAKCDELILICGRYEGVDERAASYIADEEISAGDFVLSGGEIPAMILVDAVSRFVPGVLGKQESLEEIKGSYPVYTRPAIFISGGKRQRAKGKASRKWAVPKVLMSGDHEKIAAWRRKFSGA